MEYFQLKHPIADDDPMSETDFFKWLEQNHGKPEMGVFKIALLAYLEKDGFVFKKDFISPDQLKNYKTVHEHFWWTIWNENLNKQKEKSE